MNAGRHFDRIAVQRVTATISRLGRETDGKEEKARKKEVKGRKGEGHIGEETAISESLVGLQVAGSRAGP